jgi:2-pyrone-4,6-dicarboxylate lactonase
VLPVRRYRGIALLPTDVADDELQRLDAAGFRGVRFNYMGHLGAQAPVAEVLKLAARLEPLGWHLQIHGLEPCAPAWRELERSPVPVVIDHVGRIDAAPGLHQANFQALLRLMRNKHFWVKVSASTA